MASVLLMIIIIAFYFLVYYGSLIIETANDGSSDCKARRSRIQQERGISLKIRSRMAQLEEQKEANAANDALAYRRIAKKFKAHSQKEGAGFTGSVPLF